MPKLPQRRTIRLNGYDYSESGAYFVTICTHQRVCRFGSIVDDSVKLSNYGQIAHSEWEKIAVQRHTVELDAFVVMPNHIHGVILLDKTDVRGKFPSGATSRAPTEDRLRAFGPLAKASLSSIVAAYKAAVTREIKRVHNLSSDSIWQRNYYEHVIRNESDLNRIRLYVEINPAKWAEDSLYGE